MNRKQKTELKRKHKRVLKRMKQILRTEKDKQALLYRFERIDRLKQKELTELSRQIGMPISEIEKNI